MRQTVPAVNDQYEEENKEKADAGAPGQIQAPAGDPPALHRI